MLMCIINTSVTRRNLTNIKNLKLSHFDMGSPIRCFSFTASRDWLYRYTFSSAGLRSATTEIGGGTMMHCWMPKTLKPHRPDLLLLHGFGANAMWQFADVLHHFTPKFNIYVPDLVFFGKSHTTRAERTEGFQARCVMKLLDMLGIERVVLVGVSYGGFVGYSMAAQFPTAVERLVLCCTGVCLEEQDLRQGLFHVSDLEEAAHILLPQKPDKLRELMKLSFVRPPKMMPNWVLVDFINVMCKEYVEQKRELIHEILKDRRLSELPHISQPTLIIWGEQDRVFPLELGHRLERHLGQNAELVVIKNAGHAVNIEKSRELIKHLKTFLLHSNSQVSPAKGPTRVVDQ